MRTDAASATHAFAHHDGHRIVGMLTNTPGGQLSRGTRNLPYHDRLRTSATWNDHIYCAHWSTLFVSEGVDGDLPHRAALVVWGWTRFSMLTLVSSR